MENIKTYIQENKNRFINELIELLKIPNKKFPKQIHQKIHQKKN